MKLLWLAIALITALLVAGLFVSIRIVIEYRNSKLSIVVRYLVFKYTKEKKGFTKDKKSNKQGEKVSTLAKIKAFRDGYNSVKDTLAKIFDFVGNHAELKGIYIRLKYGTGEASATGIIYGAIWSLVGNIYAFLCRYFRVEFPEIELEPIFDGKAFEAEAEGIITTRPVHIIIAVFCAARIYFQNKKKKGAV